MSKLLALVTILSLMAVYSSCGSGSSNSNHSTTDPTVSPTSAQLGGGLTQQFTSNTAVNWSVSGGGSISSSGLYTAPNPVPSRTTVTVTATSQADSTKTATATVTLTPLSSTPVTPSSGQIGGDQSKQFAAVVTNDSNTAVNWIASVGTITSSGLYTGPGPVQTQTQVTITATSAADPTKSSSATVTLMPIVVIVAPPNVTFGLPGDQQFNATVQWSANPKVNWSVNAGRIVDGFYSTPNPLPARGTAITVTATAQADNSTTGSAAVNITTPNLLAGPYAFFFQGNDSTPAMMQEAGSLIVDNVHLTVTGVEDIVQLSGAHTSVQFTGTYVPVDPNTGRGTMTINYPPGAPFSTRMFNFDVNAELNRVHFTEADSNSNVRGVGLMEFQDTSAFAAASTGGDYAFGLSGSDFGGGRVGAVGRFHMDGTSAISAGNIDINDAGNPTQTNSFSGSYTIPDSNGRGTATFTGPNSNLDFAYYVVSANEMLLVTTRNPSSSVPFTGGRALRQSNGPFTAASFAFGTKPNASVFYIDGAGGGKVGNSSDAAAGFLTTDGISAVSIGQMDENSGGSINSSLIPSGTYSVDASGNGRGTMQLANGGAAYRDLIFYFVTTDTAFLLDDNTHGHGPNVAVGYAEPQTVQNCGCTTLSGNFVWGSMGQATVKDEIESGSFIYAIGVFKQAIADISEPGSYLAKQPYSVTDTQVVKTGRGDFHRQGVPPINPEHFVLYLIAVDRAVVFSIDLGQMQPVLGVIEK